MDSLTNNELRIIQEKHGKEILKTLKESVPFCGEKLFNLAEKFFEGSDATATEYMSYVLGIDIYWKNYVYRVANCDCWYLRKNCIECKDCKEKNEYRESCKISRKLNETIDKDIENLKEEEIPTLIREDIICSYCQKNFPDSELKEVSGIKEGGEEMKWFCRTCNELKRFVESGKNLDEYLKDKIEFEKTMKEVERKVDEKFKNIKKK